METVKLTKRTILGKKVKQLRREGFLPCSISNHQAESLSVMASASDITKALRTATSATILDAELDGEQFKLSIKAIDIDPRTDLLRHVQFYAIDVNRENNFLIPISLVGTSPAVKNNLGVLVQPVSSIEMRCKLKDLVPAIEVDISKLENPGDTIAVSDVTIPEGLNFIREEQKDIVVVSITQIQKIEDIEAAEAADAAASAESADGEGAEGEAGDNNEAEGDKAE